METLGHHLVRVERLKGRISFEVGDGAVWVDCPSVWLWVSNEFSSRFTERAVGKLG